MIEERRDAMKQIRICVAVAALALSLCGCLTPDQRVASLSGQLTQMKLESRKDGEKIATLMSMNSQLERDLSYSTRRAAVLAREKEARIEESEKIRSGSREFADAVMDKLQEAVQKLELVDYIGSELISRQLSGTESKRLLVDRAHPLPLNGTIIGGRARLEAPA